MNVELKYLGRSGLVGAGPSRALRFSPNLAREPVAFDAALTQPLRFREAISALHDVVVSDLRFVPRDREAYDEWKRNELARERKIRSEEYARRKKKVFARHDDVPADLERQYDQLRNRYWWLRMKYSARLMVKNPQLWRMLAPCDPVITVADDVVFFECFSADQSSYGCLSVDRDGGFGASPSLQLGTTNVDYSWALYDHFQSLRTYRETRLVVDPAGFEVANDARPEYREEKIDLPEGWLRGFMQLQSAMTLPMRRVALSRDALYSIVAWYKRHKPQKSPRAMRFELVAGRPPTVVLEPWEQRIESHGPAYDGPAGEPIRVWGARRVLALARLLPLVETCDVYLLGTGLPSFWVVKLGEMRLTLGLSGWTANDWSGGSALDLLAPPGEAKPARIDTAADVLKKGRAARFDQLQSALVTSPGDTLATLNRLAHSGQVIYDLADQVYRWRQIMPMALGEQEFGPESKELVASREIVRNGTVRVDSETDVPGGGRMYVGKAAGKPVELVLDRDGGVRRGKCSCSHHYKSGIRRGPCRHLLALRAAAVGQGGEDASAVAWYNRVRNWSEN